MKNIYFREGWDKFTDESRIIMWFSCGATSAVAWKLAYRKYGDRVMPVYCDTGSEHHSSKKFATDISHWVGQELIILKNPKYDDIWDVFAKTRYLVGAHGARCTAELKKIVRKKFQLTDDCHVFGYDFGEIKVRVPKFLKNNPELTVYMPLIEDELNHYDCLEILRREGIELPTMYQQQKSGAPYDHNNCIGCPKGGMGYWNKIRIDYPDVFERMAKVEREVNIAICREGEDNERRKIFLDELHPDAGNFKDEPTMSCDMLCGLVYEEKIKGEI